MKTFKEITINLDSELDAAETMALEELNSYFKPNDFYVTIDQSELTVNLRLLDLQQFSLIKNTVESDFGQEVGKILNEIENSIQSIKSYGIKNGKRLYINYNSERKVKNRVAKEGRRGKYFYALNNKYINQNNELPEQFKNQIICDDSQNVLQKLPNNCVDLVFTSPPYNFGLDYEDSNDDHNWDAYFKKLFRILDECIRVLKYGGRLIINVQPLFSDYIPAIILSVIIVSKRN